MEQRRYRSRHLIPMFIGTTYTWDSLNSYFESKSRLSIPEFVSSQCSASLCLGAFIYI